jgi:hypothetical protein
MVSAFEAASNAAPVIVRVVKGGAKGKLVVLDSHNRQVLVDPKMVPVELQDVWRAEVAEKKRSHDYQHKCMAGWCRRRGPSKDFVSVPQVYTGSNEKLKVHKGKARLEFYGRMCRKDVAGDASRQPRGSNWKVCKTHFSDVAGRVWWPLHDDPVFTRRVDGIRLDEVAAHSMFSTAREAATRKHGTRYSGAAARASTIGPSMSREARANGRSASKAGFLSPGATSCSGAADGSKVSPLQAKAMADAVDEGALLIQDADALRRRVQKQEEVITLLKKKQIAPLSFETLTTGVLHGHCKQYAVLSAKGAVAMVKAAEALGLDDAWAEAMEAECKIASLSVKKALNFGFRNAAMLVCAKCKLADSFEVLGYMFGIGPSEQPLTGLIFKVTLQVLCTLLRVTVGRHPDMTQIDADTLPDFNHPMFSDVGATVDASNAATQTSHNPHGDKHSHSKYYGGNCGKYSVAISNDGLPMWLSFVYGGRGSESGIMGDSNFEEWYREFMAACVDADGVPFDPAVMADKGTKIADMMKRLKCGYITPSQLVDRDLTAQDLQENELIAKARGHVERAIGKAKRFRILVTPMHHRLLPVIDDILYFCFFATHFCDA